MQFYTFPGCGLIGSQSQLFWGLIFPLQDPRVLVPGLEFACVMPQGKGLRSFEVPLTVDPGSWGDPPGEIFSLPLLPAPVLSSCLLLWRLFSGPFSNELFPMWLQISFTLGASLVAKTVKHLPTMQETQAQSLGREDPLEEEMAPTPVLLPGKPHGWRSLVGCSPWGHKESDMIE